MYIHRISVHSLLEALVATVVVGFGVGWSEDVGPPVLPVYIYVM